MGKVALVTGGTRGIGASISKILKINKFKVIANYNSNDAAAEEFSKKNDIQVMKWDVSKYEDCSQNIEKIRKSHGNIEILVNNAGITKDAPLHKMKKEDWDKVINVNLNSVYNMSSGVINEMRINGFGRLVHISSVNGQKGQFGQTNYAATKSALVGFSKSLALESASKGITSNVIAPGYINTKFHTKTMKRSKADLLKRAKLSKLNRAGQPNEVAALIEFLMSSKSNYITGEVIPIDGGDWI